MTSSKRSSLWLVLIIALALVFSSAMGCFAATASPAAKPAIQSIKVGTQGNMIQKAPLYSKASTRSAVIRTLPKGARVTVMSVAKNMAKVKLANGKTGYTAVKYIKPIASAKIVAKHNNVYLTISVAASMTDAMNEIIKMYQIEKTYVHITPNYGGSGSLQKQIENGAPVDVFVSAAAKNMDDLAKKNLILPTTRQVLVKNRLVLIAPKDSTKVTSVDSLTKDDVKLIACGEPASVPAGKYAQESLGKLAMLDKVKSKFVLAKDVRQVLTYVESGNADAGFVYTTDALISDQVKVVLTMDDKTHSPIVYPAAVIDTTRKPATAKDFLKYLSGEKAKAVFEKYGFIMGK